MLEVFIAGIPAVVLASDHKWRGRTFLPLNYCNQLSLPRKISSFLWIFTLAPLSMKLHYTLFGSPRKADNSTQSDSAPFSDQWGAQFPDPHLSKLLTCHYDRHLSNDRHLLSNISFHVKGLQTFINNLFSEVRHQAYFSVSQVSFQSRCCTLDSALSKVPWNLPERHIWQPICGLQKKVYSSDLARIPIQIGILSTSDDHYILFCQSDWLLDMATFLLNFGN